MARKPPPKPARKAAPKSVKSALKPAKHPLKSAKPAPKPVKPALRPGAKPARKPAAKAAPVEKRKIQQTPKPAPKRQQGASKVEQPQPASRPRGNQPYEPSDQDRTMVRLLVAGGITQDRIATALNIGERTFRKYYKHEIKVGQTEIDAQAIGALVRAMRGKGKESVIAAKWWQQSRMGWSERIVIDNPAANTPMRVIVELVGPADSDGPVSRSLGETRAPLTDDVLSTIELKG